MPDNKNGVRTPSTNTIFLPVLSFTRGDAVDRHLIGTAKNSQKHTYLQIIQQFLLTRVIGSYSRQTFCDTDTRVSNFTIFFNRLDAIVALGHDVMAESFEIK